MARTSFATALTDDHMRFGLMTTSSSHIRAEFGRAADATGSPPTDARNARDVGPPKGASPQATAALALAAFNDKRTLSSQLIAWAGRDKCELVSDDGDSKTTIVAYKPQMPYAVYELVYVIVLGRTTPMCINSSPTTMLGSLNVSGKDDALGASSPAAPPFCSDQKTFQAEMARLRRRRS